MYCWNCKAQLPDGSDFCTQCGSRLTPQQPAPYGQPAEPVPAGPPAKKKKRTKMIILISAGVLVVACAVMIPLFIQAAKEAQYKDAVALVDSGEFSEAKEDFVSLGGYKDSEDMAKLCQDTLDYAQAGSLKSSGDYEGAKKIYTALGDYEDSETLAAECQNIIDYNAAVALMDAGNNEEARDTFLKLGGYTDAADMAAECQQRIDYAAATELMNNGDLQGAVTAFTALGSYKDCKQLKLDCQNKIDYAAADDAFNQGKYYTAYTLFNNLLDYNDSAVRALSCIQPNPESSELYRNPDYSTKKCPLTIKTPDDGNSSYIKIYSEDNQLVSTLFIASGNKVKVKLPKGTYRFKVADGPNWFGEEEMFGDEGYYSVVLFENYEETWTLKSNYIYTLSLRVSQGNEGRQEDRENF